ncbi:MAG: DUF420 domain-containing protein [Bryobacteraceae bacterium]
MSFQDLPALNATLNGTSAVLLVWAYVLIKKGHCEEHKKVMLAAFTVSVCFLISYLVYHWQVGTVRYPHTGFIRNVYLTILATHTILAASVPVLAIIALRRGLRGNFARHKAVARWALPIWLYVSITGVVVYLMLYQF